MLQRAGAGRPGSGTVWRRSPFLAGAALALLAGLYGGLTLLDGDLPAAASTAGQHGPLMTMGFLGTLICLERAVALRQAWGYAAPALSAAGALALPALPSTSAGALALTLAAGWLVAIYLALLGRRASPELLLQLGGAAAWYVGGMLWLAGRGVPDLVPWLAAFLVMTVAGERLELARVAFLKRGAAQGLVIAAAVMGAGAAVSVWSPEAGWRLCGVGMLVTAGWLAWHDVARHTVRSPGLPRYAAVCLLVGYVWLAVAGVLWAATGLPLQPLVYDAAVHTLFLGFVMSMVFGHAPMIVPAVLRVGLPFRRVLYVPLVVLHAGLAVRVLGDLAGNGAARAAGGVIGVIALLLFAGCVVSLIASSARREGKPACHPSR